MQNYKIFTGVVGMHYMEWAQLDVIYQLPKVYHTSFKKLPRIFQLNVGSRNSLYNIIVDLDKGYYHPDKYVIRVGTKKMASTHSYIIAVRYFMNHYKVKKDATTDQRYTRRSGRKRVHSKRHSQYPKGDVFRSH